MKNANAKLAAMTTMAPTRKRGRPRKDAAEKYSHYIAFRLPSAVADALGDQPAVQARRLLVKKLREMGQISQQAYDELQ